jgi:hypothetical protein
MDSLLLIFLPVSQCVYAVTFGVTVYYQRGWLITPLKITWKALFLTAFLYTFLQISTPIYADFWFTLVLLFITTERFSAISSFRRGENWAVGQIFAFIVIKMLVANSLLVLADSLDSGPVVKRLEPEVLGITFMICCNLLIVVLQFATVSNIAHLRDRNPESPTLFTHLTWREMKGSTIVLSLNRSVTHFTHVCRKRAISSSW